MNNNSTSNIDSTSDMSMAKPGPSGTTNTNTGVSSDSSQVIVENAPTPSKENTSAPSTPKEDASTSNDTVDLSRTESSSEQEMLRRRRLQKFSPPTE